MARRPTVAWLKGQSCRLHLKERTELVRGMLINSFVWGNTEQGHAYWAEVYANLQKVADELPDP
jgi:hypothetical protein